MAEVAQDDGVTDYTATLELRAPGALSLRVAIVDGVPRVTVTVRSLSAWLEARSALGKKPVAAVVAAQGEALPEAARGERGVLSADEAVMVVAAVGGAAVRLLPELMQQLRDGEGVAQRAVRELASQVKSAKVALVAPKNLTEHMEAERAAIIEALEATRWDRGKASDLLGMPRRTFYRRMTEYGLLEGAKPRGIKAQRMRAEAAAKLAKGGAGRQK